MRSSERPNAETPAETITRRTFTTHIAVVTEDSADELLSDLISTLEFEGRSHVLYATATEHGNVVANYRGDEIMTVKFVSNDKDKSVGKLADAELHFNGGPLEGLKLIGFGIWERRSGGRTVTFPARQYSIAGERRSFALLRPRVDATSQDKLRDLILDAYKEHELQTASEDEAAMQETAK